jgi:Bacterial SH3 domain
MKHMLSRAFVAGLIVAAGTAGASAGDCTGNVVGVRPLAQYNHANGNGFLAVRAGPGSNYAQRGELYLGDEISVWDRQGNWYYVYCMAGQCQAPLWGTPTPQGWVYGKYLRIGGVCP